MGFVYPSLPDVFVIFRDERTALGTAFVFLELNGYALTAEDNVGPFTRSVAHGEHTIDSITEWFEEHTRRVDE